MQSKFTYTKRGEMVYKKYITRNGKIYGPYNYESKRINGKVVSEYHGKKQTTLKYFFIFLFSAVFALFLGFFVYTLINNNGTNGIQGNVILESNTLLSENGSLEGQLKLSLKQGELIPADTKVIIQTSSGEKEYALSELTSDEKITGDFYIEGKDVLGNGEGYGVEGTKKVYPDVYFKLLVYSGASSNETAETGETPSGNETTETPAETPTENETAETGETPSGNETTETPAEIPSEIPVETPVETPAETPVTSETASGSEKDKTKDEKMKTDTPAEIPTENPNEVEQPIPEANPVTGNVISRFFDFVGNFFIGLTGTGKVTLEAETEVDGTASGEDSYTYTLENGQSASVVSGSVGTSNETLEDSAVSLSAENNIVTVTTDYYAEENGFGEGYLGSIGKEIIIDLNSLEFVNESEGQMNISLVYGEENIISITTNLIAGNETIASNQTILNQTTNVTTNITLNVTDEKLFLTEEEKTILLEEFGNVSIKTTKSEVVNGRLILRYELGKYWRENSYIYTENSTALEIRIENDRIIWLKDIVKILSVNETAVQEAEKFAANYSI